MPSARIPLLARAAATFGLAAGLLVALPGASAMSAAADPAPGAAAGPTPRATQTPRSPLAASEITSLTRTTVDPPATGARAATSLNDNGGWCWFQDERAIFTRDGRLMVSSVPDRTGVDGVSRDGGTEVTSLDLRTGRTWTDTLYKGLVSDDHNAAALLELPQRTLGFATDHSSKPDIYRAHLDPGGLGWVPDAPLHRPEAAVFDPALGRQSGVTYSNLAHLSEARGGAGRTYDIFRSAGETLHLISSDDQGTTWNDRGRIFTRYRAYIRMVSDGRSRIWFAITDGHPNVFDGTSLYLGYIEDEAIHRADGTVMAPLGTPVDPADLTLVAEGVQGTVAQQVDQWGADIALDPEGNPVITFTSTVPGTSPVPGKSRRHEARYARWDGTTVHQHLMGDAGSELYPGQWHYTGLSTIDPADPSHVFLSTDVDPVTGAPLVSSGDGLVHHEIFEGTTPDGGATWSWASVTANSTEDNLRPIVPNPRGGSSALIWMRGEYDHALVYDLEVVAIVHPAAPASLPAPPGRVSSPAWGVPSATPVASDLDGDGRDDLTFFGPGDAPDVQVNSLADGWTRSTYRREPSPLGTRLASGDLDGNGRADIVWHTPGGASSIWWGSTTGNPTYQTIRQPVRSLPLVGDFDGDGRADIFWYAAGVAADSIWWGHANRTFTVTAVSVSGLYRPVVGDLDGDRRDDIVWYGPGGATDSLWWATSGRRFTTQALSVGADYRPVAGDVDGDGRDEVIWHAPGSVSDRRWDLDARRGLGSRAFQVWGSYEPVLGDVDGDGREEVTWTVPATGSLTRAWGGTSYLAP